MDLVRHLGESAYKQQGDPLPESAVPGTSPDERIALMAVGGVARALAGDRCRVARRAKAVGIFGARAT